MHRFIAVLLLFAATSVMAETMPQALMDEFERLHPEHGFDDPPRVEAREAEVIHNGSRDSGQVALTFDACSRQEENRVDERVLALLRETGTQATFFAGGQWMADHADLTREFVEEEQFELGNHAYNHPDLTRMDPEDISIQLGLTQLMAKALTGEQPKYFRAPFVRIDDGVEEQAAALGMKTVQYDVASGDADESASAEQVSEHVLEAVQSGSIVVLHVNDPDLPTAQALPAILEGLREQGLEPVTLSTLLER